MEEVKASRLRYRVVEVDVRSDWAPVDGHWCPEVVRNWRFGVVSSSLSERPHLGQLEFKNNLTGTASRLFLSGSGKETMVLESLFIIDFPLQNDE